MSSPLVSLLLFLVSSLTVCNLLAQNAATSSVHTSAASTQSAQQQSSQKAVPTLKAKAQLVVVDVVVTDSSHRPVHGLKASDFTLSEGNLPQTLSHFEEHASLNAADAARFAAMPAMPPGVFTNYTPAPLNGSVNLLLLDALNTPMRDQTYVRQQLLAYLKSIPAGTRIAIFGLNSKLLLLQGFTSDPDELKAAMTASKSKGSPLLDDQVGGSGIQSSPADKLEDQMKGMPIDPRVIENMREFEAKQQSAQLKTRAQITLDAMNTIARYVANIPGRKNLIWFSGSFPINILPDINEHFEIKEGNLHNPFAAMESSADEFRETVNLMARSQVAVYPIDARGLMSSPLYEASAGKNYDQRQGPGQMLEDEDRFFNDTTSEHSTMREMADATGGRAFANTNGLTEAVASAIDEGSNFYTLTYTPTDSEWNGTLRKIKVQLSRPGVSLTYRKGYYADDPNKIKSASAAPADTAAKAGGSPISQATERAAMMRGAPTPSQVIIKVGVLPMPANQSEDKAGPGSIPAAKTHGPYRRYAVNYAIDPADITFLKNPDGKIRADFDLIIFVFDRDGVLVNSLGNRVQIVATLEQVKQMAAQGIYQHVEISTPTQGEYFLRIAVHDVYHDRYGAVEVATSQLKNVASVSVAPAAVAK
jgi:VWFA-related protein